MPFPLLAALPFLSAGVGALGAGLSAFGKEKPATQTKLQKFTPDQQQALNSMLQKAMSGLNKPLGEGFAPIAQQARTQFGQQTVPSIAERFSGMGSGAQGSSAFGQQLGQAGADLEGQLAGQQAQFGLQEQQLMQQLAQLGLTPQYDTIYEPAKPGRLQQFGQGLSQIGGATMGPAAQAYSSQQQLDALPRILKQLQQGAPPQQSSWFGGLFG